MIYFDGFINPKDLKRDPFEVEHEFIRAMDLLETMSIPAAVVVDKENAYMIGLSCLFIGTISNDL